MITPARATVMADLKKRVQGLIHMDSVVKGVEEKFSAQESSIEQRLKWAAGANPALNPVLQNFEQTLAARKKLLAVSSKSCSFSLHFLVCFGGFHMPTYFRHPLHCRRTVGEWGLNGYELALDSQILSLVVLLLTYWPITKLLQCINLVPKVCPLPTPWSGRERPWE